MREIEREGGPYLSDNSVPEQVRREGLGDMETDHLAWKQFSKLIDVREIEREGGPYLSDNSVPEQVWREGLGDMETDHLAWKQLSKLIDVREGGTGGRRQTDHWNSFQS